MKYFVSLLGLILVGLIVWAFQGPTAFFESFDIIESVRWGWVTLYDLYMGLILIGCLIHYNHKSWKITLGWTIPSFFLGNIVGAAYIVWLVSKKRSS